MRALICPGCRHTLPVPNDEEPRCSACEDVHHETTVDGIIRSYNRYNKLVARRPAQREPQTAVPRIGTSNGYDPGADLDFGNFAFYGSNVRRGLR